MFKFSGSVFLGFIIRGKNDQKVTTLLLLENSTRVKSLLAALVVERAAKECGQTIASEKHHAEEKREGSKRLANFSFPLPPY